jgi:hypothetical protein
MTLAFHSSRHLFSILQHALKGSTNKMQITKLAHQALQDWQAMASQLATHPFPITFLVPHAPHYLSTSDASQEGMGGMWLPSRLTTGMQPTVWCAPFTKEVQNNLVSQFNIMGMTTINKIELAAAVLGHATQLETIPKLSYVNTYLGLDNTAAQAWLCKGSVTTTNAPAHILHLFAQHCRCHNANLKPFYIEGYTNTIADLLLHSFSMPDDALLQTLQRLPPVQPPLVACDPTGSLGLYTELNRIKQTV